MTVTDDISNLGCVKGGRTKVSLFCYIYIQETYGHW